MRKRFELIFVAIFAGITTYVALRLVCRRFGLSRLGRVRRAVGSQPTNGDKYEATQQEYFDKFVQSSGPP